MNKLIEQLKNHVIESSKNTKFIHNNWFVKYHLEIVEKISLELCDIYKNANKDLILILVWLHDYGKILNFDKQHETTLISGKEKMLEIGFSKEIVNLAISYIKIIDNHIKEDLNNAPIEVKIVSSADGASHFIGPFHYLWWYENPNKSYEELMQDGIKKAKEDWNKKIVLPQVKKSFELRYKFFIEQIGKLPEKYLD